MSTLPPAAVARAPLRANPWFVVGLLWICGFLNYADRQAVYSVFPLIGEEFHLSNTAKGAIGSAFSLVYAGMAPFAGYVVDRFSRRSLIVGGLGVWSLVCALTGTVRGYGQLLFYRAAEGLGEAFYFPASMSLLSDYHGQGTRSRAMSLHQTSVYGGTALGGLLAGVLGERYGWRSPFWVLGAVGVAYAVVLPALLREARRGAADKSLDAGELPPPPSGSMVQNLGRVLGSPAAALLLVVFAGANFVAAAFLTWLPDYVHTIFGLSVSRAAAVAALFWPGANAIGALVGGVLADRASRRPGGRIGVQAFGLILGAPCVMAVGLAPSLTPLIAALLGTGLAKGIYDANIFASIFDVVPVEVRGFTAGLMNTCAWAGASLAPLLVGMLGDRYGLRTPLAGLGILYALAGLLALVAAAVARRSKPA